MSREIDSSDLNVLMLFYSDRVTIWVAVSSHEITDPYFIEDENENPVTVNQERYQQNIIVQFVRNYVTLQRTRSAGLPKVVQQAI